MAQSEILLSHFSEAGFKFDPTRVYREIGFMKPDGIWLSDESNMGWKEWCTEEEFALDALKSETRFLADTSRWAVLRTTQEILDFSSKYRPSDEQSRMYSLDWAEIKRDFGGLLITPYNWQCRMNFETIWYYGWDCASACVWDLSSLKEI